MVTKRGPVTVEEVDKALIESVCARLRERLSPDEAAEAESFARQYYRWVSPEDMAERSALDAYGAALSHFQFARTREPGVTKVRIYNPSFESNGWESTHTAVEIVTDDMPFLIDSVGMELNRRGYGVHLIVHPVMHVRRDADGVLLEVLPPHSDDIEGSVAESVIHAEVDHQSDPERLEALQGDLQRVIAEVRAVVEDWHAMSARAVELAAELDQAPTPLDPSEVAEAQAFLTWLAAHNFTFLGFRDYALTDESGEVRITEVAGSGLGILRHAGGPAELTPLRQAAGGRARAGDGALPAQPHEGQLARDGAPAGLPRLRGPEALRRVRPRGG